MSRPSPGRYASGDPSSDDDLAIVSGPRTPPPNWRIRPAIREDLARLVRLRELCYMHPLPEVYRWPAEAFADQLTAFPDGQLVVETEGRVVANATTCLLKLDGRLPGWKTLNLRVWGTISGHRPDGDGLYLVDVVVHPLYRRRHHALNLVEEVQKIARRRRLKNVFVLARMPGYRTHAGKLTAEEYLERVMAGRLADVSLSFWLRVGFTPQAVLPEFYPDSESCGFAVMMEWTPAGSPPPFKHDRNSDSSMTGTLVDPDLLT